MKRLLILYDGHCLLCNRFIRRLLKKDKNDRLRVAPLAEYLALETTKVLPVRVDVDSVILIDDGKISYKSSAALTVLAKLSNTPWFYNIWLWIPRQIRDGVYDVIAANRHKWFGRSETCELPDENHKKKYLFTSPMILDFLSKNHSV